MSINLEVRTDLIPKLYCLDESHLFLNWVAEGTDGSLYMVPSEPGGWMRRVMFAGQAGSLKAISPEKARAIVKFVGGEYRGGGSVAIAEGNQIVEDHYLATSASV